MPSASAPTPAPTAAATEALHVTHEPSSEFLDLLYSVLRSIRRDAGRDLESLGTTPGQHHFLRVLARYDEPPRLGTVAERLDMAPRSVTSKVDQAEADGHVRRLPDPTDRRATLIELTDEGRALLDRVHARRREDAEARLSGLDAGERAQLVALLRRVARA